MPAERRTRRTGAGARPPLRVFPTTLWEYPSQHYDSWVDDQGRLHRSAFARPGGAWAEQGSKAYTGATPSWVIWQVLMRYTRPGDTVLDPMCGSGTTLDVCRDLGRVGVGLDLAPSRPDIRQADARGLPVPDVSADFVFLDPPYSTHVDYSDDPRCIGKLEAGGEDGGRAYFGAMEGVFKEAWRVLRDRRYLAVYVSDSYRKRPGKPGGEFMAIGFELWRLLAARFRPIDVVCVVRHNRNLERANWRKAAEDGNFFLRGFNYLLIFKKEAGKGSGRPQGGSGSGEGAVR